MSPARVSLAVRPQYTGFLSRVHQMQTLGRFFLGFILASVVCVAQFGCSRHTERQERLPVRQVDPALTTQLGPETRVGDYSIHLPTGYQPMQADTLPYLNLFGVDMHMWAGDKNDPRRRSTLSVIFVKRFNTATPEDVLRQCQNQRDLTHLTQSRTERGTINGVTFARVYWSGVETFHSTGRTLLVQGRSYATTNFAHGVHLKGRNSVDCQGDTCGPRPVENTPLPLVEAAAFTFHKG